jgi:hypothetical protein
MIAKIKTKSPQTSMTFPSAGRALNKELTTSFSPSFLLITLSGLRALKALKAFNDFNAELPPEPTEKSIKEAKTTKKSKMFQLLSKYGFSLGRLVVIKPIATI